MTRKQLVEALYHHRSIETVLESGEDKIINAYLTCESCGQSVSHKDFEPLLSEARNLTELNRALHAFRAAIVSKSRNSSARCRRCGLPIEGD